MKNYSKTYENVFTGERSLKKCNIKKVSTDVDMETSEYTKKMRGIILDFQISIFDYLVKIVWLMKRFCYEGRNREKISQNGFWFDGAFAVFMRHYVGVEQRMITRNDMYNKVITYFNDFFEDFDARNPFEEKMEYPYKHITLEYLIVVYRMEERLELLAHAEKEKMSYTEFLDYVINYINNYNEEVNEVYYIFDLSHSYMPYIKINEDNQYEEKIDRRTKKGRAKKT